MIFKLENIKKCFKKYKIQVRFKSCRRWYVISFIIVCIFYFMYVTNEPVINVKVTEKPAIIHWPKLKSNLGCYYSTKDDALPAANDSNISERNNSIFFVETSCRGGINSREACAVESAARLHPNRHVNLLFCSPVTQAMLLNSSLLKLLEFQNVKLSRLHVEQYGKDTVVEQILSKSLKRSWHPIEHASDVFRYLTLYKYGGVYMDTDSILVKNIDSLPHNWIAKESANDISAGIIALSKDAFGRHLAKALLIELRNTFKPRAWGANGPKLIQRVLKRLCPNTLTRSDHCKGMKIYPPKYFYPIPYKKHRQYFKNGTIRNMEKAYMHHMWNYLTQKLKIEKDSPFAKLARKVCPTIYNMYGDEFGI